MTAKDIISRDILEHLTTDLARQLLGAGKRAFRGYMTMLEILPENRDLQAHVREAERMLTQVDVRRLPSCELGYEAGVAEGEARGETRGEARGELCGRAEGKAEAQQTIVRRLLRRLAPTQVAELLDLTPEEVVRIAEKPESES